MTTAERIDIFFTLTGIGVVIAVVALVAVAYFVIRAARTVEKLFRDVGDEVVTWRRREEDALRGVRFAGKWVTYTVRNFFKG